MIPNNFEQYRELRSSEAPRHLIEEDRTECMGCCKPAVRYSRDGYCDECLHYGYGYDQAREGTVVALLGGAVKAAMEEEIPVELIRRAVDGAIDAANEENARAHMSALAGRTVA